MVINDHTITVFIIYPGFWPNSSNTAVEKWKPHPVQLEVSLLGEIRTKVPAPSTKTCS